MKYWYTMHQCYFNIHNNTNFYFQGLVIEYLDKRKVCMEMFPAFKKITMKMHNIEHYCFQLLDCGPLTCVWTARSESRHRDFVNYSESAKNFINLLKTLCEKNQKKVASRAFNGFFSAPEVEFQGNTSTYESCTDLYAKQFCRPGDILADAVTVKNTSYRAGNIVVTGVESEDVVLVGRILKIVVRTDQVFFVVDNFEAARTRFRYFVVNTLNKISLVLQSSLADYKPLMPIGGGDTFKFVLHHHIPVKNLD